MNSIVITLLLIVFGGGGLLVFAQYRASGGEPVWAVTAYTEEWVLIKRTIIAPDKETVESLLKSQNLRIEEISQIPVWRRMLRRDAKLSDFRTKIPARQISDWAQTMASFLEAAVPVQDAIAAYAKQRPSNMCRDVMTRIQAELSGGQLKLTEAFANHSDQLGTSVIAILTAGMSSDTGLEGAFKQISEMSEKQDTIKKKWRSAMVYPIIVLSLTLAALGFMLWKVVPQFQTVYTQFKSPLPLPTRITIGISKALFSHISVPILLIVATIAVIWFLRANPKTRLMWDRISLKSPFIGKVLEGSALGNVMATLSGLMGVGVPTQEALLLAIPSAGNTWIEKVLTDVSDSLGTSDIQAAVRAHAKELPDTLVSFVETGAATADLDTVLRRYARFAQRDADVAMDSLSSSIEPLMLVLIGGMVGVIVISMYLPMITLVKVIH